MAAPPGVEDGYSVAFESLNALNILQQLAEVPDMADRAPIVVARFTKSVQAFDKVLDDLLPVARSASRSRAPIKACGQSGRSWIEIMYDVARARYGWLISEEDFEPRLAFLGGDLPAINLERMPWESVAAKVTCDVVDCRELADGMGAEFDEIEAAKGGAREPEYVTAGELAEMFGGTVGAARKRLDRYAKDNGDAVRSLLDAGSREPQRLYVFSKVKHLFATG